MRAADAGIKAGDIYNPRWIALAHDGGDTLLRVDLDPGPNGETGQVIFTDYAFDTAILLATNITQFLAQFVEDLETGRYFLDSDALEAGGEFLSCTKDIDVVNWSFSSRWKHLAR